MNNNTNNQDVKSAFDPGWNDPPTFSYNAQQSTPNRPRNFLNKRVAFPLSSSSTSPGPSPSAIIPPMSAPITAPSVLNLNTNNAEEVSIDSDNTLREVKSILQEILEKSGELGPKANDINRRLGVMEDMWTTGKLNNNVHLLMKELAVALKDDQPAKADDIHRALMVDHVSAVGSWMPGVKQLIHHSIARLELLAIDEE